MNENPQGVGIKQHASMAQPLSLPQSSNSKVPEIHHAEPRGIVAWLKRAAPTLLVLVLLGGLAYWGHQTGWSVPKFSELFGGAGKEEDDWCKEHSVPESACVECKEDLMPRAQYEWCRTHGVHDCPYEHPERAQLYEIPTITDAMLDRAERALTLKDRSGNTKNCKKIHRRIQFASEAVLDKMGVKHIESAWEETVTETVTASGEIVFEEPRVASVSSPVAGRVWHLAEQGRLGAVVKRGDVLALVDAMDVGKAKSEFLQAFFHLDAKSTELEAKRPAIDKGALGGYALVELENAKREAEIRLLAAQQALVNLGLPIQLKALKGMSSDDLARYLQFVGIPEPYAAALKGKTLSTNLYPILAPSDGRVTLAKTVRGDVVDPTKTLFVVTDTSKMWLILNIRPEDARYLRIRDAETDLVTVRRPGQTVRFKPDGGDMVEGELVWKGTDVDDKTRSVPFRAEIDNADGRLLARTPGVGSVILREETAITVPNEALHWEGDCNIVFVRDKNFQTGPKVFHVRTVRPGVRNPYGDRTEIIAGLLPGEVIATTNSAVLRSELLKNNLGAG